MPPWLAGDLETVRNRGQFASHPGKSSHPGEITDAEPREAEWNLVVLEGLFDHYYRQPAAQQCRRGNISASPDAG
jgi:hypothetical protein